VFRIGAPQQNASASARDQDQHHNARGAALVSDQELAASIGDLGSLPLDLRRAAFEVLMADIRELPITELAALLDSNADAFLGDGWSVSGGQIVRPPTVRIALLQVLAAHTGAEAEALRVTAIRHVRGPFELAALLAGTGSRDSLERSADLRAMAVAALDRSLQSFPREPGPDAVDAMDELAMAFETARYLRTEVVLDHAKALLSMHPEAAGLFLRALCDGPDDSMHRAFLQVRSVLCSETSDHPLLLSD
jgi:hypothetical protein